MGVPPLVPPSNFIFFFYFLKFKLEHGNVQRKLKIEEQGHLSYLQCVLVKCMISHFDICTCRYTSKHEDDQFVFFDQPINNVIEFLNIRLLTEDLCTYELTQRKIKHGYFFSSLKLQINLDFPTRWYTFHLFVLSFCYLSKELIQFFLFFYIIQSF